MLAQVRMWVPFCCVVLHCFCLDGGQSAGAEEAPRLAAAAEGKDWAHLKQLIAEGHEVDRAQPDGMTALHWAVYYGERSAVAALLRAGAEATAKTEYEITPLTIACRQGNADLAGLLLRSGADANSTLPGGVTPLMIAARTGDPLTVRQLLALNRPQLYCKQLCAGKLSGINSDVFYRQFNIEKMGMIFLNHVRQHGRFR